jgi:hypothetical protein
MRKQLFYVLMIVLLLFLAGCKKSADLPLPPEPPDPEPPALTEQLIGKMFFHDTGPQSQFDIFSADLYIVPKSTAVQQSTHKVEFFRSGPNRETLVKEGIHKLRQVEFNGKILERVVLHTTNAVDISQYDFEVRDLENITNSTSDDFAVNANDSNQITFVTAPDGWSNNRNNTEIVYMDLGDRVRHQLTPINGLYSGGNFDPDWKSDDVIIWSHNGRIMEVNIADLTTSGSLLPEVTSPMFDPIYSPDRTMLLFNTRQGGKKNSWVKYLDTGTLAHILPTDYYNVYPDDNPTWVFSNTRITGHLFVDGKGRIYTIDLDSSDFLILTDGQQDFRYVKPIQLGGDIYLIFSDWSDESHISLWIANDNGTVLRELNQTGDEAIFQAAGLPVPENEEDMRDIVYQYLELFDY